MPEIFSSDHLVQGPAERIELPEGYVRGLRVAVHQGEASFGDTLKDMVALSYGTGEGGELDLNQFEAAMKLQEYLQGKGGQPFAIVDIMRIDGRLARVDGVVGILADVPDQVGTRTSDREGDYTSFAIDHFNAGIAVEGNAYGVEWEKWGETLRLRSSVMIADGVLPFNFTGMFTELGTLREGQESRADVQTEQHAIAGWDILPWIAEKFEAGDRYDVFLGLLNAIRDAGPGAELYLEDQEYLRQLARDRRILSLAQAALADAQAAMRAEKEAGLDIRGAFNEKVAAIKLDKDFGFLAGRHGMKLLDELPGMAPDSVDGRLRRVEGDLNHDYHPGILVLPRA